MIDYDVIDREACEEYWNTPTIDSVPEMRPDDGYANVALRDNDYRASVGLPAWQADFPRCDEIPVMTTLEKLVWLLEW